MELTTSTESSCTGAAAPDDRGGSWGARDSASARSGGDPPGATRARGGSARLSQPGGAVDPAAGSDAGGAGAAGGATSLPGADGAGADGAASLPGTAVPGDGAVPRSPTPESQRMNAKAAAPIARPPAMMPIVSSQVR